MNTILVLDLGTTYFKASVFDEAGSLCALRRCPTPSTSPKPGYNEMDPDRFLSTIQSLILSLNDVQGGYLQNVTAITFSTQTNSFLLLDEHDEALTPIIIWNDLRANDDAEIIEHLSSLANLHATTGIPSLSPEFMVAKLLWLQKHETNAIAQAKRLCLLSDYLTLWFTGQHITEAGAAGLTGLLDIHTLNWWPESLNHFRIPTEWLPRVVRAGTDLGAIRNDLAKTLALSENCRFIVGCLDQYAGAIGAGNIAEGSISETTGTVLATVRCTYTKDSPPDIFIGPGFDQGQYFQMVFGSISANLLEAYRDMLPDNPTFEELDQAASHAPAASNRFSLKWQQDTETLITCLREWSTHYPPALITRAILENVAFALQDQLMHLCENQFPDSITCVGGAARSALWLQIKADVLNIPTRSTSCPEPTSLGAALLALRIITGTDLNTLTERCIVSHTLSTPDEDLHTQYHMRMTNEMNELGQSAYRIGSIKKEH